MICFTELQTNWLELIWISLPLMQDNCQHLLTAVALSRQVVKIPMDGDFAASLGTSSIVTLLGKLFPVSQLNIPSHILWPLLIIHFIVSPSSHKRASCMLCHLSSGIFWTILVSLCWVCISLLTWECEHPQWDTVFQVCRGGLQFHLLDTLLQLLLRMWFVLFTGRASCWLLFSLVSTCPFCQASPQQLVLGCLGLAQPSAEHHTSLTSITFFVIPVFSFIKDQLVWGSVFQSVNHS